MSLRKYLLGLGAFAGLGMTILAVNACLFPLDPRHCKSSADCEAGQICALTGEQAGANGYTNTCVPDGDSGPRPDAACEGMCCSDSPLPIPNGSGGCGPCTRGSDDCSIYASAQICQSDGSCAACESDVECEAICGSDTQRCICRVDKTCGECTINEDCDSGICDKSTGPGTCVAEISIAYVNGTIGTDGGDCGSRSAPCRTVTSALMRSNTNWVHIAQGTYIESVTISGGMIKKIVGAAKVTAGGKREIGVRFTPNATVSETVWRVIGPVTNVELRGIAIEAASRVGEANVRCEQDAVLRLYRTEVAKAIDGAVGIDISSCSLTLERSTVSGNSGGGISVVSSAPIRVRNSFIIQNGSTSSDFGGIRVGISPAVTLEFNTVAGNIAGVDFTAGIDCTVPAVARYNIVQNPNGTREVGTACAINGDETQPPYSLIGRNVPLDPTTYRLLPGVSELAIDKVDDPLGITEDFDGDPRPYPTDGKADIGADELVP